MSLKSTQQLITPQQACTPQTDDRYYRRLGWIILGSFVGIFGVWASFAPLSGAVPAPGKVIVASKNQIIQHLEGGIVKSILVNDGDRVKAAQPLIEFDSTHSQAQLDIALVQYFEALALAARLIAERDNAMGVLFPSEVLSMKDTAAMQMIIEGQKREFSARKQQNEEEKNIYMQRIEQLHSQIMGLESIVKSKKELSRSYSEEVKEWEVLYQQQFIDKMRLRDIQRDKMRIDGDIANAHSEIARSKAQINENRAQILNRRQTFVKDVVAELSGVQTKLSDLRARISALEDTLNRTVAIAPQSGIVTNLQVHTVGGVVQPGHPMMEIVPDNQPLIVEGKVAANDAVNVHSDLTAEIRFPSFAHVKSLNAIEGKVIFLAPDAMLDDKGEFLYYPVKVQVTREGIKELQKNHLALQAGMPADVMIVTQSRTFAEYLIQPLKSMFAKAFNEQ